MVATVNPCGFAMLPAYLSFFLGLEDERASISRALVVAVAVTAGFAATFAVVVLVVTRITNSVYFVVFGTGFGAIMLTLTIALAVARQSIVQSVRRVLPYVNRVAGALLLLAGAYVAWYGWIEIRDDPNDATVSRVNDWSATVAD